MYVCVSCLQTLILNYCVIYFRFKLSFRKVLAVCRLVCLSVCLFCNDCHYRVVFFYFVSKIIPLLFVFLLILIFPWTYYNYWLRDFMACVVVLVLFHFLRKPYNFIFSLGECLFVIKIIKKQILVNCNLS